MSQVGTKGTVAARRSRTGLLALGALGVVFGDIGTSPLYAFSQVFTQSDAASDTRTHVLGALSLVFWTLTLVVSVKYVGIVMRAANRGEGGIMVLAALATSARLRTARRAIVLMLLGVFGAALFYGDGMITPAISVLSAVEGLELVDPAFADAVVPLALVLLVALFVGQRFGTARIGGIFGPIMLLWFVTIGVLGLASVLQTPSVLASINPVYGLQFLVSEPLIGFLALGAVVLCVTGAEALYADMGQFGRRSVRLAWFTCAIPALYLNYLGQGALVLRSPDSVGDSFYLLVPSPMLVPMLVLATLATIIASQAVISGAFSMTQQAVRLGYLPRMRILHTSSTEEGQVYVPAVNWTLMAAIIGLVLAFRSSDRLGSAYGIAVTGTFVITTMLVTVVARRVWGLPLAVVVPVSALFLVIDIAFFSANLTKFTDGGWFPLSVAGVIFSALVIWQWGYRRLSARAAEATMSVEDVVREAASGRIARVPGTAVYFTSDDFAPFSITQRMHATGSLSQTTVIAHIETADVPFVSDEQRLTVVDHGHGVHTLTAHYGFMQQPVLDQVWSLCAQHGLTIDPSTAVFVFQAVRVEADSPLRKVPEHVFAIMYRNALDPARYYSLPPGQVVEFGRLIRL